VDRDLDAIKRVIDAFERSDWTEIDVRSGDVRVHLVAGGAPTRTEPTPSAPIHDDPAPQIAPTVDEAPLPPGARVVVSPSPGIFWRAPQPGAPPFAAVGDTVAAHATIGIVEVMKLMNHVKAGVDGRVVAVFASDGVAVGKGERLVAIAPERS
jgi:acetyl-CoA carboxylase biotin carboxyl carrier protein